MSNDKISSYWGVPPHITGLFQIYYDDNPLKMGSCGAGFSLANFNSTSASFNDVETIILFNGEKIEGNVTTSVIKSFELDLENKPLKIEHNCVYPMQAGFGTSGAGALGTAYALNELLDTKKTDIELGQIAHTAEVNCRTGLGDVLAQTIGKAEVRIQPGAPGYGEIIAIDWPKEKQILTASMGKIPTKKIITNEDMIQKINKFSKQGLDNLRKTPNLETFLEASFNFALNTGLMSGKLKELILELRAANFKANMIMLGQSLFVIDNKSSLNKCKKLIKELNPNAIIWIDSLADSGPRKLSLDELPKIGEIND